MTVALIGIRIFQPKFTVGVVGVIFNAEGQVLLVEHVFHAFRPWGLPGGWIGRNETPAQAVCREMKEELQLTVTIEVLLLADVSEPDHLDIAYLCSPAGSIGALNHELLDYGWFNVSKLPQLHRFHYKAIKQAVEVDKTGHIQ